MPAPTRATVIQRAARYPGRTPWLRFAIAAGAAANTNITLSGIRRHHLLLAVLEFQPPTAASGSAIVADRAGVTTITAPDTIQLTVTTTGNQLLVVWLDSEG